MNALTYSQRGLILTEQYEGLETTAYFDKFAKVWTIGYGHTGREVVQGLVWTIQQCKQALNLDIQWAVAVVNENVIPTINQNQFDALVDFTFNAGAGSFLTSTLLRLVNTSDFINAANEFGKWVHSRGVVVPGLVRRRAEEKTLFLSTV